MKISNCHVVHEESMNISDDLTAQWTEVTQSIKNPSFIHDVRWFKAYLASKPEVLKDCHIFSLVCKGKTIAIFPLEYLTKSQYGMLIRKWRIFWPNDMDINDFILEEPHHDLDYLGMLSDYLAKHVSLPWDMLELQHVPENASITQLLSKYTVTRLVSEHDHESKYLACGATYEDSIKNISSKFKRNNRRKRRNLEKLGTVTTTYYNKPVELKQAFEYFLDVEAANWKGQARTALRHDSDQLYFYRALLQEFSDTENYDDTRQFVIHTLNLNEAPIAAQLALLSGNTLYLLKIGYDAEYHAMAPGGLLLDETLKRFSGSPDVKYVSFITGAKWNDDWAPQVHKVYNHYIYNRTLKGFIAWLAEKSKSVLRPIKHKLQSLTNS